MKQDNNNASNDLRWLVEAGILSEDAVKQATRATAAYFIDPVSSAIALGFLDSTEYRNRLALRLNLARLPLGELQGVSASALAKVPGELAERLQIMPFHFDGVTLSVAVGSQSSFDGVSELAKQVKLKVEARVALPFEIEVAIRRAYPLQFRRTHETAGGEERASRLREVLGAMHRGETRVTKGMPRPESISKVEMRTELPSKQPVDMVSQTRNEKMRDAAVERMPFYSCLEQIHEASDLKGVATQVASGLANYFERTMVIRVEPFHGRMLAYCSQEILKAAIPVGGLGPLANWREPLLHQRRDPKSKLLVFADAFGLTAGGAFVLATVADPENAGFLVFGDQQNDQELYDELNDVKVLFAEAERRIRTLAEEDKPS